MRAGLSLRMMLEHRQGNCSRRPAGVTLSCSRRIDLRPTVEHARARRRSPQPLPGRAAVGRKPDRRSRDRGAARAGGRCPAVSAQLRRDSRHVRAAAVASSGHTDLCPGDAARPRRPLARRATRRPPPAQLLSAAVAGRGPHGACPRRTGRAFRARLPAGLRFGHLLPRRACMHGLSRPRVQASRDLAPALLVAMQPERGDRDGAGRTSRDMAQRRALHREHDAHRRASRELRHSP